MNIEDHEFFEVSTKAEDHGDYVEISYPDYYQSTDFCGSLVSVYKNDVIALAKHFKLDLALLNDIEQTFVNGTGTDFIDVFASYKRNLELEK